MTYKTIWDRVVADKNIDEEKWLQARRLGVTATDIRDLEKGSDSIRRNLLHEKRTGERSFHGSHETRWGLEREVVLGKSIEKRFGHKPSDVTFHAPGNKKFLATPDGLHEKDGVFTICEIKTSKHDLRPGSEAFIRSHFAAQCQWQMMVAGDDVNECLFVWEVRIGKEGKYIPGERGFAWIERDDNHIAELVDIANGFLAELEKSPEEIADDPDDYLNLVAEWVSAKRVNERTAKQMAEIEEQLRLQIGDRQKFHIETPAGKVTLTTPKPSRRFDSTSFKTEHPDLYGQFTVESQSKPSLRITPSKELYY